MEETLNLAPLNWSVRNGSMPVMPGTNTAYVDHLRHVLGSLERSSFNDPQMPIKDSAGKIRPLAWYGNQLSPSGLLTRTSDQGIQLTPSAREWLDADSPALLVMIFHRHVRLIGELMALLQDGPTTVSELTTLANERFRLGWKSYDPVRRRISWLSNLGFVLDAGGLRHGLTLAGKELVGELQVVDPASLWTDSTESEQIELSAPGPEVSTLIEGLSADESGHAQRGHVVSYIPSGPGQTAVDTLRLLTSAAVPEIALERFDTICAEQFGIKSSSARSALTTMRSLGLYDLVGRNKFAATASAQEWLDSGDDLALIRIVHCNMRFVGELLQHVDALKRAPALHGLAVSEYGLEAANKSSIGRLMQLLHVTGLIQEIAYAQFETTPLGRLLREELPLATPKSELERQAILADLLSSDAATDVDSMVSELREASLDSITPIRFEKAIQSAFERLGVSAQHLGGAGRTDVLVDLGVGALTSGTAIVDAKSSAAGVVTEKAISFQALREHRKKHGAKFAAVIAPSFPEGRLHEWATDEDVALLSVDQLVTLLRRQLVTPLSPGELSLVFTGTPGWVAVEALWNRYDRDNELTRLVVTSLLREAEEDDPLLGSSLDTRSIYRELRDQIHPRPSEEELREELSFLASHFVRLVQVGKNGYSLLESPATTADRLRSIASVLESTTLDQVGAGGSL